MSTIEAIYWIVREYDAVVKEKRRIEEDGANVVESTLLVERGYEGKYDNLLLYFMVQHETIQRYYNQHRGKKFTQKRINAETYIKYL